MNRHEREDNKRRCLVEFAVDYPGDPVVEVRRCVLHQNHRVKNTDHVVEHRDGSQHACPETIRQQ